MEHVFVDRVLEGGPSNYLHPTGFQSDIGGTSVIAMPPGKVDVMYEVTRPSINVIPFQPAVNTLTKMNGIDIKNAFDGTKGANFLGEGSDMEIQAVNPDWELLIEFDPASLERMDAEATDGMNLTDLDFHADAHPASLALGQMAIAHLREPLVDKIYLEGLSIALFARTMGSAMPGRTAVSTVGTDRRINRAIDYIRADLTKPMTIADLAAIACMSPSWFSRAFRAQTGMTVHAYIQERRLERASLLLQTGSDSLASIAWDCGFADHSHLTRLFRKRYGIPPSSVRAG